MTTLLTPANLHGYQRIGYNHILDVDRCALWAGMGLGKTVASLTAVSSLIDMGESNPTLVLGPLRVAKTVWGKEVDKWSHLRGLRVVPIVGDEAARIKALRLDAEIFTINYEGLVWLVEHLKGRWPFNIVVADEASKLKGFRTRQGGKRTTALATVAHTKVKRFIELTGTQAPNGLGDLWGQMWFLDKGARLGKSYTAFNNRWFRPNFNGYGVTMLPHSLEEVQGLIRDLCLSIDAKDWFDLKEPIVTDVRVQLPSSVQQMYRSMEKDYFMALACGTEVEAANAAAKSMKLVQVAAGAVYVDSAPENDAHAKSKQWKLVHDEKLDALDEILAEGDGSPVLVSYQFRSDLARLQKRYPEGRTLSDDTQMTEFKTGKYRLAFGHPASVGHGIDGLQEHCYTLVNFSRGWNLENDQQMTERIGPTRQFQSGHERNVFVYNIIAEGTLDEDIARRMVTKASVQDTLRLAMRRIKDQG